MGLEAYRIRLTPLHSIQKQQIIDQFIKQGFIISGNSFGDIYLEKAYDCGYIEIAIHNSEQHRIALNDYKSQHNRSEYVNLYPVENKETITIQIAKPNNESIIDALVTDLRNFNSVIPIEVTDLQTKDTIDLNQCSNLKSHFKAEHDEFNRWYPKPTYPLRCRDVFKKFETE